MNGAYMGICYVQLQFLNEVDWFQMASEPCDSVRCGSSKAGMQDVLSLSQNMMHTSTALTKITKQIMNRMVAVTLI